jgi:hypothetical protein
MAKKTVEQKAADRADWKAACEIRSIETCITLAICGAMEQIDYILTKYSEPADMGWCTETHKGFFNERLEKLTNRLQQTIARDRETLVSVLRGSVDFRDTLASLAKFTAPCKIL